MKYLFVSFTFLFLFGCISTKQYRALQNDNQRLKKDSSLLEKRITHLFDENNRLKEQSATMEQSLNLRLKEKQDSLVEKEQVLRNKEASLFDMRQRQFDKAASFNTLVSSIFREFSDYDKQSLVLNKSCSGAEIWVNERKLFVNQSKTDLFAQELNVKAIRLLEKNPDLQLRLVFFVDTTVTPTVKGEEPFQMAANKSLNFYRQLIGMNKAVANRITSAITIKNYALIQETPTVLFIFYSSYLPCLNSD